MKLFFFSAMTICMAAGGLTAGVVTNGSFETPTQVFPNYFTYDPLGATWAFTGNAGIAANGSGFGYLSAVSGTQVAFLQTGQPTNLFSETVTVNAGDVISFVDAMRPGFGADTFTVSYNGVVLATYTPTTTAWTAQTVAIPTGAPASGILQFAGLGTIGVDLDAGIDSVTIAAATPEPFSVLLFGSGLLAVSLIGRRTISRKKLG